MESQATSANMLLRLMSASSLRARVVANNIANQNVPGFKRQTVQFEELLQGELSRPSGRLARVEPRVVVDTESPSRPDGNNVVLEEEVSSLRENRLLFEMYANILQGRMHMLESAVHGDR